MKKIILLIALLFIFGCSSDNSTKEEPGICTLEYAPVCGKINVQCITTPCDPVQETFSNMCNAEYAEAFDIYEGECITNFQECIDAGNPAMESYPRQCRANGKTFIEEI